MPDLVLQRAEANAPRRDTTAVVVPSSYNTFTGDAAGGVGKGKVEAKIEKKGCQQPALGRKVASSSDADDTSKGWCGSKRLFLLEFMVALVCGFCQCVKFNLLGSYPWPWERGQTNRLDETRLKLRNGFVSHFPAQCLTFGAGRATSRVRPRLPQSKLETHRLWLEDGLSVDAVAEVRCNKASTVRGYLSGELWVSRKERAQQPVAGFSLAFSVGYHGVVCRRMSGGRTVVEERLSLGGSGSITATLSGVGWRGEEGDPLLGGS